MRAAQLEEEAFEKLKKAEKTEREAEILRIETMARDYNDIFWRYEDERASINQMRRDTSLKMPDPQELSFEIYRALDYTLHSGTSSVGVWNTPRGIGSYFPKKGE